MVNLKRQKIKKIEKLDAGEEYVYDISMRNQDPYFFANGTLVHNTDSVYFTAWPMVEADVASGKMEWNVELATALYETISDQCNESFPGFMLKAHNCPQHLGEIILGGREITASTALFIKKKRYAALVIDNEGKRCDVDGKPGYLKAMGLDLKRSDTPVVVQDFLSEVLLDALTDVPKADIMDKMREFKKHFCNLDSWKKGTPKRVNNLTKYGDLEKAKGKANMPGHVRAAINWNNLRKMNSDNYSPEITDGAKTIVCKLKDNPMGLTSVGYPIDEENLPNWFKELPFDDDLMERTIVDQKLENLFGVLKWNLQDHIQIKSTFNDLFDFG